MLSRPPTTRRRSSSHRGFIPLSVAMLSVAHLCAADVVELVGGAKLTGSVPEEQQRTTLTISLEGGGRLTLDRKQVAKVSSESEAAIEYRKRSATAPDTVESHWALAQWCQQHRLADEYRRRLERVLELDPMHEEARRLLGYQLHAGRWLNREQLLAARGMVRHNGEYRTRQEIAILERKERAEQQTADWKDRLERWRRNLNHRDPDRSREAVKGFETLADPACGPVLATMLLKEKDAGTKALLIQAASQVRHGATVRALSTLALDDPSEEVRYICLEHLTRAQTPGLAQPFVGALRSKDNARVNRAALGLEELARPSTTGALIDALVTEHTFVPAQTAPGEQTYTMSQGGGFSFGDNRPKPVKRDVRNAQVLSALVKITGENFGYDEQLWRNWLASTVIETTIDLRRDL